MRRAVWAPALELFFTRTVGAAAAIYRATRASAGAAFGTPARVAAIDGFVEAPALSADGERLYFHKRVGERYTICRVRRVRAPG